MPGRHQTAPGSRPRVRWLVGLAGLAVTTATLLAFSPAGAASTVNAQLSLTGVATSDNILGGSQIGVHPGDTVNFKASALPTAGLQNIPGLGGVLDSLLSPLLGQYQVVVSFSSSFPGGAQTVTLGGPTSGACAGVPAKSVTFPAKGSYAFTWKVQYVLPGLLGCSTNGVSSTNLNLLQQAGVALNATNSWVGKIVVADNPPKGGISIQLPGVSVAPNIGGHQLPTIGVPGINLPTLGVAVPDLNPGSKQGDSKAGGGGSKSGKTTSAAPTLPGNVVPVPAQVVPRGSGDGVFTDGGFNTGVLPGLGSQSGDSSGLLPISTGNGNGSAAKTGAAAPAAQPDQKSSGKHKTIDLASGRSSTGQLSIVLALIAIIALFSVAGLYARLYLIRKG
jgi:hypothetical protein